MSRIDILLATYNGARFLPEQLASLENQTHKDWHLLVRDDGSSDATLQIVREWAGRVEQRVTILEDGRSGLGASLNFAALLEQSDAPYFAFCDQDDVWLPEKLEVMLAALNANFAQQAKDKPQLAFCDLLVVNENLKPTASSFWQLSRLSVASHALVPQQQMLRNSVTGCATLGNAALRIEALPIPADARMHDWWLAMVASANGGLLPVPQPLVQYRQHGGNVIGAMDSAFFTLIRRFISGPRQSLGRAIAARDNSQRQARAFADRYRGEAFAECDWVKIVRTYGQLPHQPVWQRKWFLLRHRLGKANPLYFIALLSVI